MGFGVYFPHTVTYIGVFLSKRLTGSSPRLFSLSVSGDNKGTPTFLSPVVLESKSKLRWMIVSRFWVFQGLNEPNVVLRNWGSGLLTPDHKDFTHCTSTRSAVRVD